MTETGGPGREELERLGGHHDALKDGWKRTLADMHAMAEERAEEGWETVPVGAGDTAPEHPDAGADDRWGLVYVIPDNSAGPFREAYGRGGGDFPAFDVYRARIEGAVFLVTELRDPDSQTAILLAGQYTLAEARPLIETAREAGRTYTHVRTLDGTWLGSFEHAAWERFFPEA